MNTIRSHILKHTVVSRQHLTPEIPLRLITPSCPLWSARAEESPFQDPFWAFYWPGGQATARYILDNTDIVKNRRVLDVGCGCGAVAIAASKMQAKYVLANDIDPYATTATQINSEINKSSVAVDNRDLIGSRCAEFDTVLIGDMFYNEEFADVLFKWLHRLAAEDKLVLIGDPGRHGLTDKSKNQMTLLAKYDLPKESCMENHGFTDTTLWRLNS